MSTRLTTKTVVALRAAYRKGASLDELMEQFQICRDHLRDVITGKKWKMVPGALPLRKDTKPGPRSRYTPRERLAAVTCACGGVKSKTAARCRHCAAEARCGVPMSEAGRANVKAAAEKRRNRAS